MDVHSSESQVPISPPAARTKRRWVFRAILILLMALCVGEIISRFYLGLGDPLIYVADEKIQFYCKPSHTYHRFGNTISINAYGMRSADFPPHKINPNELRILVIGDSVIFGGAQVDQPDVCTSVAQRILRHDLQRPVVVANVSAGNWRLTNMDEYIKRFGTFDADVMIIVLSAHDYAYAARPFPYTDFDPDFPSRAPLLALSELIGRYGVRYVGYYLHRTHAPPDNLSIVATQSDIDAGMSAFRDILTTAKNRNIRVAVLQHLRTTEYDKPEKPGHALIKNTAESFGVPVIQLAPEFKAAMDAGHSPYRDDIHTSATGQAIIASAIVREVESLVKSPATRP